MNVQVARTLDGRIVRVSDPIPGSGHDTHCLSESNILAAGDPANWIGDKGHLGNGMTTPIRKPACRGLLDWEKEFNTQANRIRSAVERAIANLKTWRILHTDYRRPVETFATTISAVVALYFYAACE